MNKPGGKKRRPGFLPSPSPYSYNEAFWIRLSVFGGFSVALMVCVLHTAMAWTYFRPSARNFLDLLPYPGPFFASAWMRHGIRCLAAALFFLSLPGLGRLCLPAGRRGSPFVSIGLALVLWSTAGFLIAAAGLSRPEYLRPLSLALVALGLLKTPWREFRSAWEGVPRLPALGLAAFIVFYFLTTLVPDTFYDALVYHLAAPQAWLQAGRMTDMPDLHLWRLPGLMQPLYLWALAWSDDRLCKLLNLGLGFLTAGLIYRWSARRWGAETGAWAALLFLSAPMIGVNLWCCANDIPSGFFAFLSLTLWVESRETKDDGALFWAGVFFGAAAAAKGTALFAAPFYAMVLAALVRREGKSSLRPLLLFGAGCLLPLLPWWIRAAHWTGNPFFPQATAFLGGDAPANLELIKAWKADAAGEGNFLFRSLSLARESLRGIEDGRFGFVGPLLLMLLPLAFFLREDPAYALLAGYALAAYAAFASSTGRLRYFIPHLPALFVLGGACLTDYARGVSGLPKKYMARMGPSLRFLAAAAAALNLLWLALAFQRFNEGWPVVWGKTSSEDYLRQEHIGVYGNPSQGAFDWLRDNNARGRLFVIGEARTFRSPIPARAAGTFNVPAYALWAGDPPSPETLLNRLRREGFTHLLINVEEMKRITPEAYRTGPDLRALGLLFDSLPPPLYRDRWCILFSLPTG